MHADPAANSLGARTARHAAVGSALALMSDRQLQQLVEDARVIGTGIGGTTAVLQLAGTPVFVKRVALTDLERRPQHVGSTANLFALPTFYQYGIGSSGFGVWREVAAHVLTTEWVLGGQSESFPLLYHHRVLAGPPAQVRVDLEQLIAFWDSSPAVRDRLEGIAQAPASVALFLEYIPQNLDEWLTAQVARGGDAIDSACALLEQCLERDVAVMNAHGLLHFDAHFRNILTDGTRLYFADLGLATSTRFDLSDAEAAFVERNASHDRCYVIREWVNWLVTAVAGAVDRDGFLRRCVDGTADLADVPPPAAAIITRYAEVAIVMNELYRQLRVERTAPYPRDELERACAKIRA